MADSAIRVTIRDLTETVFDGDVMAISSVNEKGPFDILSSHANFISLIKDGITLTHLDGAKQEIKLNAGVIRNADNVVDVFIGVETL